MCENKEDKHMATALSKNMLTLKKNSIQSARMLLFVQEKKA